MPKSAPFLVTCLLGAATVTFSGCASLNPSSNQDNAHAQAAKAAPAEPAIEYADFQPEVLYLLTSAEIAAQRGRYDVTLVNYLKAAKQSRDKGVIARAMRIAQSLNADNAQTQLADLWLDVEPDNLQAHRVAAIQAVKRNDLEAALGHMEHILNQGADADFDSLAAMAGNLPKEQQQELLSLYQKMAERHPNNPELEYSIALLLKLNGQSGMALKRLDALLEAHDNFQPAIVLRGELLYEAGRKEDALDYLMTNTRRFPDSRQMGTLYARMLIDEGDLQAAQDEFQRLVERYPDNAGLLLSHALVALENGEKDTARDELTSLVERGHHSNEASYYLGRIAESDGNKDGAIGFYQSVEQGSFYFPALARASALLVEQGRADEALAQVRTLRDSHPKQAENFWLLEVNLLLDAKRPDEALASATKALDAYPDNAQILYARGMLYDSLDQPEKAEADLTRIVEREPNNAVALNALGYILTTRTDRLEEARGYITRALKLDPNNPAILDSMGWVLYQEGRLDAALPYLKSAWKAYPDPEVAAHYGEVLWMAGDEEQARIVWKQGLKTDPNHPVLRETLERLTGSTRP
ncbi:tetratricopeptide repeat protein [Marinobacter sp. C2H3]|uniref:tetratricopeptide repeat protein n=1 Tax=Marinobacter sp. C2H3 TaxID=3119003 RepID=UPI00300EBCBC